MWITWCISTFYPKKSGKNHVDNFGLEFFCGKPWEMKAGKSCAFCQDSLRNPWGMDLQEEENRRWWRKLTENTESINENKRKSKTESIQG